MGGSRLQEVVGHRGSTRVHVQCFVSSFFALLGMEKEKDPTDKSGGERRKKGNLIFKLSRTKFPKRVKKLPCM